MREDVMRPKAMKIFDSLRDQNILTLNVPRELGREIVIVLKSQLAGALGAALLAQEKLKAIRGSNLIC